jgi:serine/threonine protein kinase/parvulin-like peptidyl-prolyl isomerase
MIAPNTILQNRYLTLRSIGQGGMGTVYLAKDQRLGNTVALKETLFTDARSRRAFEREARILAQVRHPALPKVIDHFEESDGQFLVMEFIPGDDLEALLAQRGRPFDVEQVLQWADQLLDALDYLHTQETPILHRDIKPSNLKLTPRGQIILLDFGLAKGSVGMMTSTATSHSVLGFTPNFAPLEQIKGGGTDTRSDLYSLGATLYYLLTGVIPPDALSRAAASVSEEPDPLRLAHELNLQISPVVSEVLRRAMSHSPKHRPASADEMRRALRQARETLVTDRSEAKTLSMSPQVEAVEMNPMSSLPLTVASQPPPTYETPLPIPTFAVFPNQSMPPPAPAFRQISQPSRSNRMPLIIGVVLVVLAIGVAVFFFLKSRDAESASQPSVTAEEARREGIAATVNGEKIMLTEVDKLINQQMGTQQTPQMSPTQLSQARLQVLDSLIQKEAVYQRAEKEGLTPSDEEATKYLNDLKQQSNMTEEEFQKRLQEQDQTLESLHEEARKQLAIQKLQEKYSGNTTVTEKEIEDFYNTNRGQFVNKRGVGLANIAVYPADNGIADDAKGDTAAKAKIDDIYQQLKLGADFGSLARSRNEDNSNQKDGDIGFATEDDLKQNGFSRDLIAKFFYTMQVGDFTEPVRFSNGNWYIFKLKSRHLQNENLSLDSPGVHEEIAKAVRDQRKQLANAALLSEIMNQAKVVNFLASSVSDSSSKTSIQK